MKQQVTKRLPAKKSKYKKCVIYSGNGSYYHVINYKNLMCAAFSKAGNESRRFFESVMKAVRGLAGRPLVLTYPPAAE
jgi:hypothetical protein